MATFVLVHGAGHGGWCWERLVPLLRGKGHAVYAPTLSGIGNRFAEVSPQTGPSIHITELAGLIEAEDLRKVILVGHSYGGIVITGVAGKVAGRIAELVFLDAPQPRHGECLADTMPGIRGPLERTMRIVDGIEFYLFPSARAVELLGIREPEDVAWVTPLLSPHPWRCFVEPLEVEDQEGLDAIPRSAIDSIESLRLRDPEMAARAKAAKRTWQVDAGHDIMITDPRRLADILIEIAENPYGTPAR